MEFSLPVPKYSYLPIVALFFITGLLLTACSGSPQPKTYTIGVLNFAVGLENSVLPGFKEGMTQFGYKEGQNITYIYKGVPDKVDKLDTLAQDLVKADVDLILSITTPATQAAQRATVNTDIPVVFVPLNDPVGAGVVDSLKKPGGNITGITFGAQEARRFEWLIQVAPAIKQVYILYNPKEPSMVKSLATVSEVAQKLGVELITREVNTPEEATASIENIPEEADAIFFLASGSIGDHIADFAKVAIQHKLPTSGSSPEVVEKYGIMTSYGFDVAASGKQAARLADQILRGIKPADLPVEMTEFSSAINLKTASTIGLDIPDTILRQANVIVR
jgi:putative tryptophan/tyrosine transport system substrate-binding protein